MKGLPLPQARSRSLYPTWTRISFILLLFVFAGSAFSLLHLFSHDSRWDSNKSRPFEIQNAYEGLSAGQRKLVIVLPVNEPSPDLCKLLASAVALGYPAPVIVNWNDVFHNVKDGFGPSHLTKITGTLDYLSWATGDSVSESERLAEDDLVLVLDAYDIWMQLTPDILIHRYFSRNAQANKRLAADPRFADGDLVQQTLMVSAQKGCVAPRNRISDLHCNAVPQSPLPEDVFGFFTDSWLMRTPYQRPRYVNSGSFMGPAGDMRRYFERVSERMEEDLAVLGDRANKDLAGDQGIFAEIYGEQEVWRRSVKAENAADVKVGSVARTSEAEEYEYHLGLDYTQELFYPTCNSERGGSFVRLHDAQDLTHQSSQAGVKPPRIRGLPRDLATADGPWAKLDDSELRGRSWGDAALYVDFWTTSVPALLHHNAWRHGLKSRRTTWWDRTWFFPHLRRLLEVQVSANSTEPLFHAETSNGSLEVWQYGSLESPKLPMLFQADRRTGTSGLRTTSWDSVCRSNDDDVEAETPWYDEVFRDGKGSFR